MGCTKCQIKTDKKDSRLARRRAKIKEKRERIRQMRAAKNKKGGKNETQDLKGQLNHLSWDLRNKTHQNLKGQSVVSLSQANFSHGPVVLNQPGIYRLVEDIVFHPARTNQWSKFTYTLEINCSDVILDLNGYLLQLSPESALQYGRHYHIYLSGAQSCVIQNGTLGLSSYAGIYGFQSRQLLIRNLEMIDFEVIGICLVDCHKVVVKDVTLYRNRQNVPVTSQFRLYQALAGQLGSKEGCSLDKNLQGEISNVLSSIQRDVLETGGVKENTGLDLFKNTSGNTDMNCVGVYIGMADPEAGDFTDRVDQFCEQISLENVKVNFLKATVTETIGLSQKGGSGIQADKLGGVIPIKQITQNEKYLGNVISRLQFALSSTQIDQSLVDWQTNGLNLTQVMNDNQYEFVCNGNCWHHVLKGVVGIRLDACHKFQLKNCRIADLTNQGKMGWEGISYRRSHDYQVQLGYHGSDVRGISLSYCQQGEILTTEVNGLTSYNGQVIGIDVQNNSHQVTVGNCQVRNLSAGIKDTNGNWIGQSTYDLLPTTSYNPNLPNLIPKATGIQVSLDSGEVTVKKPVIEVENFQAAGAIVPIWKKP